MKMDQNEALKRARIASAKWRKANFNSKSDPTPRIGKDGDWRGYDSILGPVVNESMIIVWGKNVSLLLGSDGGTPVTMTSPVASIEEVN
jgi:hypothetical protein